MVNSDESMSDHAGQPLSSQESRGGPRIRPPQTESEVNGGIGGEKGWADRQTETSEDLAKRQEGQRRAEEREMIRRAARRLIVFGHSAEAGRPGMSRSEPEHEPEPQGRARKKIANDRGHSSNDHQRRCEALMNGAVVEPSFAKGNWAIRWREGI